MLFVNLLTNLCYCSLDGVEYSKDKKVLISTPNDLVDYKVPKICEIINGGNSPLKSSFLPCKDSIKTLSFEKDSNLVCIYPYVFKASSIVSADLSECHHLLSLNYSVFFGCNSLSKVLLPEGMIRLCPGCFAFSSSLTSISIPDSVEYMDAYESGHFSVFTHSAINKINFTENSNLKIICSDVFSGTKLTELYIPRNTSELSTGIFNSTITNFIIHPENRHFYFDGTSLLSYDKTVLHYLKYNTGMTYNVPDTVQVFASHCCRNNGLTKIVFTNPIQEFGDFAFGATNLVNFDYPSGSTKVTQRLFRSATRLKKVTLTSSITVIEFQAFSYCSVLETVVMQEGITEIENEAFYSSPNLRTFKCPKSLSTIGTGVFYNCQNLEFDRNGNPNFNVVNGILFTGGGKNAQEYFGKDSEIVLPSECEVVTNAAFSGKPITKVTFKTTTKLSIQRDAFSGTKIAEIHFPECIELLGSSAFLGVSTLKKVFIPSNAPLKTIHNRCFYDCPLTHITLPTGLEAIKSMAFAETSQLTSIDLASTSLINLEASAFYRSGITIVTLPSTLNTIGEECFKESKIQSAVFDSCNLTILSINAFANCDSLSNIQLSDNINTLSIFSFQNCISLEEIVLPLHINTIEQQAFDGCSNLRKFSLKRNCDLSKIGGLAFNGCDKLMEIGVEPDDNNFYVSEGVLMNKGKTTLYLFLPNSPKSLFVVPASITNIESYAFCGCKNLQALVIPEGEIKSLGYRAVDGCSKLSMLFLPPTLTNFGKDTFFGCTGLKCGSVTYAVEDRTSAIIAGIPEIAFSTNCPKENKLSCKVISTHSLNPFIHMAFFLIAQ